MKAYNHIGKREFEHLKDILHGITEIIDIKVWCQAERTIYQQKPKSIAVNYVEYLIYMECEKHFN